MKKLTLFFSVLLLPISNSINAIQILPAPQNSGAEFGKAFGEGFSKGFEGAQQIEKERQLREQLQMEQRKAEEINYYNKVVQELSYEQTHPTLTLSNELKKPFIDQGQIKMNDNRTIGYIFKRKFNRVTATGPLVEWLWSLDLTNQSQKKFLSLGKLEYEKIRIRIELVDSAGFVLSTCNLYANIFLKVGEQTSIQGKWVIPYDQASEVANYQISFGG